MIVVTSSLRLQEIQKN